MEANPKLAAKKMTFTVPEPGNRVDLAMADGAVIRLRQHGNCLGPRLVLCHGNGFAIDAYFPFWRFLTDQYDLVIYDQRSHGQNPRHTLEAHRLDNFVSDMEEVFHGIKREFGDKPAIGVFHSVSGVTSIRHALEYGKRWQALILFDPAMGPGPGRPESEVGRKFELMLVDWAKRRPDNFASPKELADQFAKARPLQRWVPGARELMAKATLHEDSETGKWVLNCPGAAESQIYKDNSECHLTERMDKIPVPVRLICADPDQPDALAPSKVGRAVHAEFGLPYVAVENTNHLLQIEKPVACARLARSFIEKLLADDPGTAL